ncbi:MFS transporter [Streptomyces sp. R302]|uniref:MFS transporter n=1 Tax=unclassified Streptomyces TaxID=2593676 RepID=UPI00145F8414|nr:MULTISPECIES: MFS transporter [unclassified Streptomyces]NML52006.1 MFS transporter [Streptomyces sp. R301]NML81626.1 MFS transporter [Streptomyces sp. R302]
MPSVLRDRTYRHLFLAQVVALTGTGLATVALALLAYDLAGGQAAAVLGTALALKMAAYVGLAPLAGVLARRMPRRTLLVGADLVRLLAALVLPFVDQVWQVYALVLLLQAASAVFTPAFQATIPRVLPHEGDYTRALTLSRLAYDLESLASPVLAAALLTLMPYGWLFAGTAAGFLLSALLVLPLRLPADADASGHAPTPTPTPTPTAGHGQARGPAASARVLGARVFLATPRLRALLALDLAVAAAGALVLVDTVVLVQDGLGRSAGDVSLALAAYGAGSMTVALLLPRVLGRTGDRALMLPAAGALAAALGLLTAGLASGWADAHPAAAWPALLLLWLWLGAATSAVLTPGGRLLRRSAVPADLPGVFAAHFSLSHGCWLLTYPLAGWLAARAGLAASAAALGAVALAAALAAVRLWPRRDPEELAHTHPELPAGHPHMADAPAGGPVRAHVHAFRIDALHRHWPTPVG